MGSVNSVDFCLSFFVCYYMWLVCVCFDLRLPDYVCFGCL